MERNEKEKNEEPWTGRSILGVAAAGAAAVATGAFFLLSAVGDSSTDKDHAAEDTPARPRKTMKAPGSGGETIFRDRFEEDPRNYFRTSRAAEDTPARPRKTMKAPGSGGETFFRDRFEEDPRNYFRTSREKGTKAAVDEFK